MLANNSKSNATPTAGATGCAAASVAGALAIIPSVAGAAVSIGIAVTRSTPVTTVTAAARRPPATTRRAS